MKVITLSLAFIFCSFIQAADFEYVGTNKCKSCHKSAKKGEQYVKWEASSHSKAYATLLTEKAVAIAKEMKLETAPHESAECLICHTVGFGSGGYEVQDEAFYNPADDDKKGKKAAKRMLNLQNVGCESCHGPGSKYKSKKVMQAIYTGATKGLDVGMNEVSKETCLECHNEKSPTSKEFNFEEMLAKISHPMPEAPEK